MRITLSVYISTVGIMHINMSETTIHSPVNIEGQSQIVISSLITIGVLIISAVIVAITCFKLIGKFSY